MPKQGLAWLVAVATFALVVFVAVEVPSAPPEPESGSLPLAVGALTLPNEGTYYVPCSSATLPTWWAVYLLPANGSNLTLSVSGTWRSTRGTQVVVGVLGDDDALSVLGTWVTFLHCPPIQPPGPSPPPPPALPYNGTIAEAVTLSPAAHRVFVEFVSFSGADLVSITEPVQVLPIP